MQLTADILTYFAGVIQIGQVLGIVNALLVQQVAGPGGTLLNGRFLDELLHGAEEKIVRHNAEHTGSGQDRAVDRSTLVLGMGLQKNIRDDQQDGLGQRKEQIVIQHAGRGFADEAIPKLYGDETENRQQDEICQPDQKCGGRVCGQGHVIHRVALSP